MAEESMCRFVSTETEDLGLADNTDGGRTICQQALFMGLDEGV